MVEELFRRMVFNLVFANQDDHLKNHSFIYDEHNDKWELAPAYDLTYSLNPLLNFTSTSRVLSVNGKRTAIQLEDILAVADAYTIKNAKGIIAEVQHATTTWPAVAKQLSIPLKIINSIKKDFAEFK